jgi:hypothetical protein
MEIFNTFRRFLHAQAAEEAKFDDLRLPRINDRQTIERFINRDHTAKK